MNRRSGLLARRSIYIVICILSFCMLLPILLTPVAATPTTALNYANPNSPVTVHVGAVDFVSMLTGEALSSVEQTHLNKTLGDDVFCYSDAVPVSYVHSEYEGAVLRVTARVYAYTAENGAEVTWTPTVATAGGEQQPMEYSAEQDAYLARFALPNPLEQTAVRVEYSCSIRIAATSANRFRNHTYNAAVALRQQQDVYTTYERNLQRYNNYLLAKQEYERTYPLWEQYVAEKEKYDIKYAAYEAYLAELSAYRMAVQEYDSYLQAYKTYQNLYQAYETAYEKYLTDMAAYDAALKAYEEYAAAKQRVEDTLAVMNSIYTPNSQGKKLYATLKGNTVSQVLDQKDALISAGISPTLIDQAASSTEALKVLLAPYAGLEGPSAQLEYYKEHYEDIRDNICDLYGALYQLFKNNNVKFVLDKEYHKLERYMEFVSQLYVISTGLDDEVARNPDWFIVGLPTNTAQYRFTFSELLEECQIPADKNNADPSALPSLGEAVISPSLPQPPSYKPVEPTPVPPPGAAPDPVLEPTAPEFVPKPTAPAVVSHPGEAPAKPVFTEEEQALLNALASGIIHRRATGAVTLTLQTTVSTTVPAAQTSIVTFYDHDGRKVLAEYSLVRGESIFYDGPAPTREQTAKYTYHFANWKTDDGQDVSSFGVAKRAHETFYAAYDATVRAYTVTWLLDGKTEQQTVPYGTLPDLGSTPQKAPDAANIYAFSAWSPAMAPVTGDATYEAIFTATPRSYTVTWVVDGVESQTTWPYGATPVFSGSTEKAFDGKYVYTFTGWDTSIDTVCRDVTYTAIYQKTPLARDGDGDVLAVTDTGTSLRVACPVGNVELGVLMSTALANDRTVELVFDGGEVVMTLGEALLSDLTAAGCRSICVESTTPAGAACGLSIRYVGATPVYHATLQLPCGGKASAATVAYAVSADGTKHQQACTYDAALAAVTVKQTGDVSLLLYNEYALTHDDQSGDHLPPVLITLPQRAVAGELITLQPRFEDGYALRLLRVTGVSGQEYALTAAEDGSYFFVMPDEAVTITSALMLREYTVRFEVDGVEISSQHYHKGDTVVLPDAPTRAQQGDTVFTFAGWSPAVTTVTEDVTYVATFTSATVGDHGAYVPNYTDGFNYILFFGILFLLLCGTGIMLLVLHRKNKIHLPFFRAR